MTEDTLNRDNFKKSKIGIDTSSEEENENVTSFITENKKKKTGSSGKSGSGGSKEKPSFIEVPENELLLLKKNNDLNESIVFDPQMQIIDNHFQHKFEENKGPTKQPDLISFYS